MQNYKQNKIKHSAISEGLKPDV